MLFFSQTKKSTAHYSSFAFKIVNVSTNAWQCLFLIVIFKLKFVNTIYFFRKKKKKVLFHVGATILFVWGLWYHRWLWTTMFSCDGLVAVVMATCVVVVVVVVFRFLKCCLSIKWTVRMDKPWSAWRSVRSLHWSRRLISTMRMGSFKWPSRGACRLAWWAHVFSHHSSHSHQHYSPFISFIFFVVDEIHCRRAEWHANKHDDWRFVQKF